jgi:hypothetical protein
MSELKVNKVTPRSGTTVTLGDSGDTITIPSGATITNSGTATGFGGIFESQLLHVRDEKSALSTGGTSTVGYQTRVLNTVVTNEISGASLSSNIITLPSGTFYVTAMAMTLRSGQNKLFFYNNTDSADVLIGSQAFNGASDTLTVPAFVSGRFTIASSKNFILRHYIQESKAGDGLGQGDVSLGTEIYADVQIWKVA